MILPLESDGRGTFHLAHHSLKLREIALMAALSENPLGVLTFIVAPAILTNASSVMSLGTSNRFARAIDRVRELSGVVRGKTEETADAEMKLRIRQLRTAERRSLLLVRALTAFYVSVGGFAAASLVSLLAAAFFLAGHETLRHGTLGIALCAGLTGVAGLVCGSALLVVETRLAVRILSDEREFWADKSGQEQAPPN